MRPTAGARRRTRATAESRWLQRVVPGDAGRRGQRVLSRLSGRCAGGSGMSGKVVVNRCMSLDGYIAGPGDAMDWGDGRPLADYVAPKDFAEVAAATGAMLVGRR